MKHYSLKQRAIDYRRKGYSYGMILEKIGVPKSTLSGWLAEISFTPNQEMIKRIGRARAQLAQSRHDEKLASIRKAKKLAKEEIKTITERDLFMMGIGLYWGEGDKGSAGIINSDPKIIKITIKWFKKVCGIKMDNFRITIHAYPDNNIKETIDYWSKITGIPKNQFQKTQIDRRKDKKRKKKRMLPYGTVKLVIKSNGKKEFGVFLHRRIMGWIEAVVEQNK